MTLLPALRVLAYTLLDEIARNVRDYFSETPYWLLFLGAAVLVGLFIFGLVKKMIVFCVVLAVIAAAVCALWFYAGHFVAFQ